MWRTDTSTVWWKDTVHCVDEYRFIYTVYCSIWRCKKKKRSLKTVSPPCGLAEGGVRDRDITLSFPYSLPFLSKPPACVSLHWLWTPAAGWRRRAAHEALISYTLIYTVQPAANINTDQVDLTWPPVLPVLNNSSHFATVFVGLW